MPPLHPLNGLIGAIENQHIKQALLDELGPDYSKPLTNAGIRRLIRAGAKSDPSVDGHDLNFSERTDYGRIAPQLREHNLYANPQGPLVWFKELSKFRGPNIGPTCADARLRMTSVGVNKVEISGRAAGGLGSSAGLQMTVERYSITPKADEGHSSVAKRLAAALEARGWVVKLYVRSAKTTLEVLPMRQLKVSSLTTDRNVKMEIGSGSEVNMAIATGTMLSGGYLGVRIDGKRFITKTSPTEAPQLALDRLRQQIEEGGYEVKGGGTPTPEALYVTWTFRLDRAN